MPAGRYIGLLVHVPRAASLVHDHAPLTIASTIHDGGHTPYEPATPGDPAAHLNRSVCGRCGCLRVPSGWSELVLSLCSTPVMHIVVCGALVENGAVLLVHRSPTRRAYPDLWDLPGGHVEAGESELRALAREMHEELGVHIVAESSSRLGDLHAGSGEDAVHVGVWQIRDWVGPPTNRAPEEHDDIAWVGISELGGLPLVFGALPALLRSRPEPDRPPRRDEARTTASPSGP
jgi:8-oxo-dGTP pyrophosphatase MutT (NUDIX family)